MENNCHNVVEVNRLCFVINKDIRTKRHASPRQNGTRFTTRPICKFCKEVKYLLCLAITILTELLYSVETISRNNNKDVR